MNRFRTKKRAKDDSSSRRPSEETDGGHSFFGRRKKAPVEEEKPVLDLENALPKTDDFRTSLLMTGLSARFSMLREQDDPNTKIGKASDDSVLSPKRHSRIGDLGGFGGLGGLADIAEVESIKGSYARMNSYASASDDADSGMMNRSKPTDGNNLFGGRQKIYKIPAGAKSSTAGMGGRAVYDEDVPMSSFQRWRQAERERRGEDPSQLGYDDEMHSTTDEQQQRADSPPLVGYNTRRETSSTTSSAPSIQRNSTAATSVVSAPAQSAQQAAKEWPSPNPSSNSSATPAIERTVTRTRRLYEQGLSQDSQDQQFSASTRIDTIRRGLGCRTPDTSVTSPSPTTHGFADRFDARRNILAKVSAPNLRSLSPPASGSSISSTVDTGVRPGRSPVAEARAVFGVEPPLSPPNSETGAEHSILSIQPNDRGKATALGVFNKPSQKYDDSTYAQRQLQLQQGRDSPSTRFRTESTNTFDTIRSRSTSSSRRERSVDKVKPLEETRAEPQTFLDDSDDGTAHLPSIAHVLPAAGPPVIPERERPSDSEHPAFRQSALPTPLSFISTSDTDELSGPSPGRYNFLSPQSHPHDSGSLVSDSPTLGPTSSSGLGGMVRSHLRSDSNTSSVYGGAPPTAGLDTRFPTDPFEGKDLGNMSGLKSNPNPWEARDSQWGVSVYGIDGLAGTDKKVDTLQTLGEAKSENEEPPLPNLPIQYSAIKVEKEKEDQNEFARELAEGARRVRERLTSYVESDSSRTASPHSESPNDLLPPPRPHGLGLLKPKNSRGSLIDRNRVDNNNNNNNKSIKMLGLGSATMTTSPTPGKQSLDEATPLATMKEEPGKEEYTSPQGNSQGNPQGNAPGSYSQELVAPPAPQQESVSMPPPVQDPKEEPREEPIQDDDPSPEDSKMHPGVKAFRLARREMQRLREVETQARHNAQELTEPTARTTPPREAGEGGRTPSKERKPPPGFLQVLSGSDESNQGGAGNTSRLSSRAATSDRDRSGSEASNGGRPQSRPPRLRNGSILLPERIYPAGFNGPPPLRMRSPGLPGTDIRRSPHMPPQAYPGNGATSPGYFGHQPYPQNGNLQPRGRLESGHPSPTSPLPPSPFATTNSRSTTPTGLGAPRSRGPSVPTTPSFENPPSLNGAKHELIKKQVRKTEISDPTFVSTTSRVPTVNLPETSRSRSTSGSRSRSSSNATQSQYAPPIPLINPRRRNDTKTRTMFGAFMGRNNGNDESSSMSSPYLPLAASLNHEPADDGDRSAFSHSEDEDDKQSRRRLRLRKIPSEANATNSRTRASTRGGSPPYAASRISRAVVSPPRPPPSANGMGDLGLPGGMI